MTYTADNRLPATTVGAEWVSIDDPDLGEQLTVEVRAYHGFFSIDGLRPGWYLQVSGDAFALADVDGKPLPCESCGFEPKHVRQLRLEDAGAAILCLNCYALGDDREA